MKKIIKLVVTSIFLITVIMSLTMGTANADLPICDVPEDSCPMQDGPKPVYFPDPEAPECGSFCECRNGTPYKIYCPSGLNFDPDPIRQVCVFPDTYPCPTPKQQ